MENLIKELDKPTRNKFIQWILDLLDAIKAKFSKGDKKILNEIASLERRFTDLLRDVKTEENLSAKSKHSIESKNKKISVGMTDTERTEILKNKTLTVPIYKGQADTQIQQRIKDLNSQKHDLIQKALLKIADDFNAFGKYSVKDMDIEISVLKSNLNESIAKKATPTQIAKLLPILQSSLQNAIGIETHVNRYFYDNNTVAFANLLSGYAENNMFIPIRFGVKLSANNAKLYIVIDENPIKKIKVDINDAQVPQKVSADTSTSTFKASISRIFELVNNKDLLRYIPDDMLNSEQKQAKQEAIAETIKYTDDKNDTKYKEFIIKGDQASLKRMVQTAAKLAGYTGTYYHGSPDKFTVFDKKKARSSGTWGKGFYFTKDKSHANQYGNSFKVYLNLGNVMKPNAETLSDAEIRKLIEAVAENEDFSIENYGTNDTNKIFAKFESKDAFKVLIDLNTTAIGDFAEALKLFNDVLNKNYTSIETELETVVYSPEQIKSADLITYDENDNVIPISKRFNSKNPDFRYSISNADTSKFVPIAKKLMKQNDADGDASDFAEVLKKSFIEAQKDDTGAWDSVMPAVPGARVQTLPFS